MQKDFLDEERFLFGGKHQDNEYCDFDNIDLLNLPNGAIKRERKIRNNHKNRKSHNTVTKKSYFDEGPIDQNSAGDGFSSEKNIFDKLRASVLAEEKKRFVNCDKNCKTNKQSKVSCMATTIPDDDFLVPRHKKNISKNKLVQLKSETVERSEPNRYFPFKSTPSGNLKVESRQVVYETKKFSVLVASPTNTQVRVADKIVEKPRGREVREVREVREALPNNMALNALMEKEFKNTSISALISKKFTKSQRLRTKDEELENDGLSDERILQPEKRLEELRSFKGSGNIDWDAINLPTKKNLFMELYQRITKFTHTDCRIYIDNEEFNCHLIVLQCYSEYFEDYNGVRKVELRSDQVSASAFAFIYEWMILGDPSYKELTRENVLDVFSSAKFLKIKDLIEQCWTFIDHQTIFTEVTAFILYVEAKERCLHEVCELMLPRVQKFFLMLVSSRDWLDLDVDDIKNLLKSNYISVNCEMEVFMSAVRWLRHDWERRDRYKVDLMRCVRFGNLAAWQLVDIKRNPDNPEFQRLSHDPDICKMIDDGLAYVIIKYWYGDENEDYQHWNSILGLREVEPRNWSGVERNYLTYRDFLIYLDGYRRTEVRALQKAAQESYVNLNQNSSGTSTPKLVKLEEFPFINSNKHQPLRKKQNERNRRMLSKSEAVRIIERAYLQYKMRKKLKELKRRLKSPVCHDSQKKFCKSSSIFKRFYPRASDLPKFLWNGAPTTSTTPSQVYTMYSAKTLKHDTPKSSRASSPNKIKTQYLSEGSLFNLEHESVLIFGGINVHGDYGVGINTGKDIYRYMPLKNDWEYVGEMPAPRTHHGLAFLGGRIYLVGGSDPREDDVKGKFLVVDTVWSFDPVNKIWYEETCLNVKRKNFGLVVSGKHLFAIGGQDKHSRVTDSVEKYNLSTGRWGFVTAMRHPRMGIACTKFEEKIWVGGGMCGSSQRPLTDIVECYDIQHDQWTDVARLRVPRCFASFFAMSNNLYLIAGAGRNSEEVNNTISFSSIDIWDKNKGVWKQHAEMEVARHGHTTGYLGTQILIIGGVTTVFMRGLNSIECYCTSRGTWIRGMCPLPHNFTGHATVTLPPAILL